MKEEHEIKAELHWICTIRAFREPIYAASSARDRMRKLSQSELEELRNALHRQFNVIIGWIRDVEDEQAKQG